MTATQPQQKCDLVMKGGVTSGVVYPRAITELSREYQFSSIGGTSAGAIAAAVTAAAEYARAGGKTDAFEVVDKLPDWLGDIAPDKKHTNLFHLFQPLPSLSGLYSVITAGLGKTGIRKSLITLFTALLSFPVASLRGTLPGIFLMAVASCAKPTWLSIVGLILSTLLIVLGSVVGALSAIVLQASQIPAKSWGVCSGMTEQGRGESPALVPWLSTYLNTLAGKPTAEPLTFGDLASRGINLQMITTNLTNGRPYSMPFGEHTHFFYKPEELLKFFPDDVVEWMNKHQGTRSSRDDEGQVDHTDLAVFPDAANLPVVVAVRMSLSFPFLFCPIPLHGVDFGFGPKTVDNKQHIPESCFFVDGGLANNLPLNLFDHALPRWPTFGINLRDVDDGRHKQQVFIPCQNSGGLEEWWTRFDEKKGLGGLVSFFGLLFDTSRNWRDNLQLSVPGYRDRVAHIGLDPAREGGLNLDMPKDIISLLTDRGARAGGAILSRYSPTADYPRQPGCVVDLENQKWIRFRSFMELLEDSLLSIDESLTYSATGESNYLQLIAKTKNTSYDMTDPQRRYAKDLLDQLMSLVPSVTRAREMGHSFRTKVPKPKPELRVTPHF
jgi:predicted acylesterase/phospholipase RssA